MPHTDAHILPNLSIDCVIFGYEAEQLKLLLIRRQAPPEVGRWALPGGFILEDEDLRQSALRILKELTGLENIYMEQLHTFGRVDRYPGRRVITVAYYALINPQRSQLTVPHCRWFNFYELPQLALDHGRIVSLAYERLRHQLRFKPIGFELLPPKFTLSQIHRLYEVILNVKLDKPNFRRKLEKMNLLIRLDEQQQGVAHRAARLYQFDASVYERLRQKGFVFEV
ncbi:MAG: NUDIX hydrolase [Bacteroidetes bacterium]|nr:MAG: NUDIX hydrolase [Bacteroidota bacterium]